MYGTKADPPAPIPVAVNEGQLVNGINMKVNFHNLPPNHFEKALNIRCPPPVDQPIVWPGDERDNQWGCQGFGDRAGGRGRERNAAKHIHRCRQEYLTAWVNP
jgi:hypothetical protein